MHSRDHPSIRQVQVQGRYDKTRRPLLLFSTAASLSKQARRPSSASGDQAGSCSLGVKFNLTCEKGKSFSAAAATRDSGEFVSIERRPQGANDISQTITCAPNCAPRAGCVCDEAESTPHRTAPAKQSESSGKMLIIVPRPDRPMRCCFARHRMPIDGMWMCCGALNRC